MKLPEGNTGVLLGLLLVSFVILVALITVLSGIGVAEHGGIGSGGVYSMISSVLGGQMGGTIGLLYVFGQVQLAIHMCPITPIHMFRRRVGGCIGPGLGGAVVGIQGRFGSGLRGPSCGDGRACGSRRGKAEDKARIPVTKLGRLVKDMKIKSLEETYQFSLPIKESKIIDFFLGASLKDEVLKIMLVQKQTLASGAEEKEDTVGCTCKLLLVDNF
ncbi:hypothetical protein A6R68_21028 [Neotoma lepida]|uniref:Uncharacterized protein n=1 Tax=Neotoma lepida TaxID=56216 RepID=A0A1A6HRY9_NEOLE|nr:hypothetical protein A6R68_21028 [Neotoma lepida]